MNKDKFTGPMYFKLWWPAMFSSVGWALSDMADAVVVGQKLGATGLAAISLILPVYMFNCMMAHGFGLGGSVRFSTLLSKGKEAEANRHFSAVLELSMACSIVTAALGILFLDQLLAFLGTTSSDGKLFYATKDYLFILVLSTPLFYLSNILNYFLRNDSCQRRAGIGSVIGNVTDIGLNIILVLGLGLGTGGAALSTSIGQMIAIAVYLPGLYGKESHLTPKLLKRLPVKDVMKSLRSGFATSVQYLYQMVFFWLCNNVLMRLSGENGVAVFDLIQNTSYLILYLYEGTARAVQPILSTYYGEHNVSGRRNAVRLGFASGIAVGTLLIAAVMVFPNAFCRLFGMTEAALASMAAEALRIYCAGAFFAGISILTCNYYQSCERLKAVFLIETMRGAVVLLPCTLLFASCGIEKFWLLFPATEIVSLLIFLLWRRFSHYIVDDGDPERVFQYTISGSVTDLTEVCGRIEDFCVKWNASAGQRYFVVMTVEELGMAILTKGMKDRDDGYIQITVIAAENGKFKLYLRDNAWKFNPFEMETKRANSEDEVFMDSMGILVLKEKAEDFYYQRYQGFNSLVLTI